MAIRLALAAVLVATLHAARLRTWLERPAPAAPCALEGRGIPPRHHLGCATDPGLPRALSSDERLVLGLPLDPNVAGSRELAFVPGLSRRLAAAIVQDRERNGAYAEVADLARVRGIGPKRLEQAGRHLLVAPPVAGSPGVR